MALNLLAPLYCAQAANTVMQDQADGGSIVNIASVSGLRPSPGTAAYGAAKAGLINLTQSLAVEWAPKVRVNALSAGLVATEAADDHYGGAEGMAAVAATVPLGRFGTPEDMAGMCLFLASPLAAYVTGANLVAHGVASGRRSWPPPSGPRAVAAEPARRGHGRRQRPDRSAPVPAPGRSGRPGGSPKPLKCRPQRSMYDRGPEPPSRPRGGRRSGSPAGRRRADQPSRPSPWPGPRTSSTCPSSTCPTGRLLGHGGPGPVASTRPTGASRRTT